MRATDWLEQMTSRNAAWWVAAVQKAISDHTSPTEDPNHGHTDVEKMHAAVTKLVRESMPASGETYDENMRSMAVLSMVAALWFGRVQYAKAHSPARPNSLRRSAYARWISWAMALASIPLDEREDAVYFPTQGWDFPFAFEAKDGDFI